MQMSTDETSGRGFAPRRTFLRIWGFVGIDGLLITLLLACLCLRVWGMGLLHTDDAAWALSAYQPSADPVGDWARNQGRLWAFAIGPLMLRALFWQGTPYGELLKLGSFGVFFFSFYAVVTAYWGRRVAGLAACLFVALHALRWEGSALTGYPLLVWVSGTLCAFAILAGRRYFKSGGTIAFIATGILLFVALFNNEGVTLLFCILFLCSVLGNVAKGKPITQFNFGALTAGRSRNLALLGIAVPLLYGLAAGLWLVAHPTKYDGHSMAAFDAANIFDTLLNFALSGSVLYDLYVPYRVVFSDAMTNTGSAVVYDIFSYGGQLLSRPVTLLVGFMIAWAAFATLRRPRDDGERGWNFLPIIMVGLIVASVAILPVAITEKYQLWHLQLSVNSYTMTILAHFGVTLLLAGILVPLIPPRGFGVALILIVAALLGSLGAVGYRMNDAIAADMRPEAGRWRVLALALMTLDATNQSPPIVFAPRFRSGSWFTVVPADYWTDYVKAKYGRNIEVFTKPSEILNTSSDVSMLDYGLQEDERRFLLTMAHVAGSATERHIDSIAVAIERPDPSTLAFYVLSFRDRNGELVQKRLVDMPIVPGGLEIHTMTGLSAQVDSVRLTKGAVLADSTKAEKTN
jgi:hypothetical protein